MRVDAETPMVWVRVTPTIANEYLTREALPEVPRIAGTYNLTRKVALDMLEDAEFNGDTKQGPDEMPLAIGNAYRALVRQLRSALLQDCPVQALNSGVAK